MIDGFLILTPILLLAVIALLGFVGCDQILGLSQAYESVGYVDTVVYVEPATSNSGQDTTTFNAVLNGLQGGELIVLALQWKGNPPTIPANLSSVAGPYTWQIKTSALPQTISNIEVYTAMNPAGQGQFAVEINLNSVVSWSICLSAYTTVDANAPTYSPQSAQVSSSANNPVTNFQTTQIGLSAGDALYAVAFAADSGGSLTLEANNLAVGPGFTLDNPGATNPIVEHLITSGGGGNQSLPAVVVNNAGDTANLFVLGMGIKAASQS